MTRKAIKLEIEQDLDYFEGANMALERKVWVPITNLLDLTKRKTNE